MNKNEMHRVPGFTAEQALEQGASTPYAGLALRGAGGGAVAPAFSLFPVRTRMVWLIAVQISGPNVPPGVSRPGDE